MYRRIQLLSVALIAMTARISPAYEVEVSVPTESSTAFQSEVMQPADCIQECLPACETQCLPAAVCPMRVTPKVIVHMATPEVVIKEKKANCSGIQQCGHCGHGDGGCGPLIYCNKTKNKYFGGSAPMGAPAFVPVTQSVPAFATATVPITMQTTTMVPFGAQFGMQATGVGQVANVGAPVTQSVDLSGAIENIRQVKAFAEELQKANAAFGAAATSQGTKASSQDANVPVDNSRIADLEIRVNKLQNDVDDINQRLRQLCK